MNLYFKLDRNISIILLILLSSLCFGSLSCMGADKKTVDAFHRAEELIGEGDYKKAQMVFDSLFSIPGIVKDTIFARILVEQSTLYLNTGQREKAKSAALRALPIIDPDKDQIVNTSLWNNLGIIYNRSGMADSALYCYEKSLQHASKSGDLSWVAASELNIGMLYYNRKQIAKAENYFMKAADNAARCDDGYTELISSQLLASSQLMQGKTEAGGKNIRKAWNLAEESEDASLQLRCIPALMRYHYSVGKPDSAAFYYSLGRQLLENVPADSPVASGFYSAEIDHALRQGRYREAASFIRQLQLSPMAPPKNDTYKMLAECLSKSGDFKEAFAMMDSARIWTDSLASSEAVKAMSEFNVKYSVLEKEMANRELSNRLIKRERTILWVLLVLTMVSLVALILVINRKQLKRRMKFKEKENELLASKRYIEGIEEERDYLARELHDGVAGDMLALQLNIEREGKGELADRAARIRDSLRSVSHHLIPPDFRNMTLDEVSRLYIEAFGKDNPELPLSVEFVSAGDFREIPLDTSLHLYRILQQELTNIAMHSGAMHADVSMCCENGEVRISLGYDGSLPPDNILKSGPGIGMRSIDDRIKVIDGMLKRFVSNGKAVTEITVGLEMK